MNDADSKSVTAVPPYPSRSLICPQVSQTIPMETITAVTTIVVNVTKNTHMDIRLVRMVPRSICKYDSDAAHQRHECFLATQYCYPGITFQQQQPQSALQLNISVFLLNSSAGFSCGAFHMCAINCTSHVWKVNFILRCQFVGGLLKIIFL